MTPAAQLDELESVLRQVVPTLASLRELTGSLRGAITQNDLRQLLQVVTQQEESNARLSSLERRRQQIQSELESALGVHGVREIVEHAATAPERQQSLSLLLDTVREGVLELQAQNEQNQKLLESVTAVSERMSLLFERLAPPEATYTSRVARARRARRAVPA